MGYLKIKLYIYLKKEVFLIKSIDVFNSVNQ